MKYNHTVGPAPKGNKPMRLTKADDPPAGNRIPLVNTGVCVFLAIAGYLMSAGADLAGTTIWLLYLAPGGKAPMKIESTICSNYLGSGVRDCYDSTERIAFC